MKNKLDIILPVYMEEENIEKVVLGISKHIKTPHKILAIWQDPSDPSIVVLKKLKNKYKNLYLYESIGGIGLLHAIKTGFKHSSADVTVIMMSDFSDDPRDVDKMVGLVNSGYDIVCGSRYMPNGKRIGGSRIKAFLSWFTCISLYHIAGIPTHDATNAFKCFNSKIKKINIESKNGFELPLEIVVKSHKLGYRIGEVATIWKERGKGYSKFNILDLSPFYIRWYKYALKTAFNYEN